MKHVEIYIGGQAIPLEDDGVEIEVFDEVGVSCFGEITVAEMVRRVQLHGELVRALGDLVWGANDLDAARAVLAKVKP